VPTVSRRTLRFIDGTQVAVIGLDEILAELYAEGRQMDQETAKEMIKRLEAHENYIPTSEVTRREYTHLLLKEYQEYIESRSDNKDKKDI